MIPDDFYDALVAHVYRAGQGEGTWEDLLNALASNLDCWSAHLMGFHPRSGAMVFGHDGGSPPPESRLDYIRQWHRCDPRTALLMRAPPDTWVHCHEHLGDDFVAHDRFYQDFLIPYGGRYVSGIYFAASSDLVCIFSLQRGVGQQPFDADERRMVDRIGKHVKAALLLQMKARETLRQGAAGYALLQRMRYPVLLVDEHQTVLFENEPARDLMRSKTWIAHENGTLTLAHSDISGKLTTILAALSTKQQSSAESSPKVRPFFAVHVGHDSLVAVHVSPLKPQETMNAFGNMPVYLLTMYPIRDEVQLDPFLLAAAFDLTPAESRVAVAIAQGLTDADVAQRMGTAPGTVRSQTKSVYMKMDVSHRSELARILHSSPAFWSASSRGSKQPPRV